ncbi:cell surface protein [Companilactobacillus paralimentarius DSM 13238 = JCM 10415]|uniref:Cell surface protein n=1 Tax=Companilactobacillus paralimentarius DSM 13238 = JCM 10415 TaxID=1122151 RepID=A0A0R1PRT9_9LACO|nr:cell surface protein [Companilactobacillus paralimentarius DSM 13238 = JCM 10415]
MLTGMSATTVNADETDSATATTQSTDNQTDQSQISGNNAAQTAKGAVTQNTVQNQNVAGSTNAAQTASAQSSATAQAPVATQSSTSGVATQSVNNDVQDGGNVSEDFPDVANNKLGYASKFHIFANEATLNAHTNGNVAVGNLNGNVNFGTNVTEDKLIDKDISYVENVHNLANSSFVNKTDSRSNKVIFGVDNDIKLGENGNNPSVNEIKIDHLDNDEIYQDKGTNKYIDFKEYFEELEQTSSDLANSHTTVSIKNSDFPDRNQRVINLENYEPTNNQIVIDLDADVLDMDTPLTIAGLSSDKGGTTIIINVDGKGVNPLNVNSQIKLIYNHGDGVNNVERPNQETEFFDDNHLLWNFYDSSASDNQFAGDIEINRPFQGSILAPDATINIHQNLDGNIVADKVNVLGGETHRWDLQDNSDIETEFEKPVVIPGEVDWFPNEGEEPDEEKPDENDGSNIEEPDEEEDMDIDEDGNLGVDPENPDENNNNEGNTTDPENPEENNNEDEDDTTDTGDNGGTPDEEKPSEEDNGGSTVTPDTDKEEEEDSDSEEATTEEDGNQNLINGGSEGSQSESNAEEGLLPDTAGNKDESELPTTGTSDEAGALPQTGEASSILATIAGIVLIIFGFLLKTTKTKKN